MALSDKIEAWADKRIGEYIAGIFDPADPPETVIVDDQIVYRLDREASKSCTPPQDAA